MSKKFSIAGGKESIKKKYKKANFEISLAGMVNHTGNEMSVYAGRIQSNLKPGLA